MPSGLELHVRGSPGAAQALWHLSPHLCPHPVQGSRRRRLPAEVFCLGPHAGCRPPLGVHVVSPQHMTLLSPCSGAWRYPKTHMSCCCFCLGWRTLLVGQQLADAQGPLRVEGFGPAAYGCLQESSECCVLWAGRLWAGPVGPCILDFTRHCPHWNWFFLTDKGFHFFYVESDGNCDWKTFNPPPGKLALLGRCQLRCLRADFLPICGFAFSFWEQAPCWWVCFALLTHSADPHLAPAVFGEQSGGTRHVLPAFTKCWVSKGSFPSRESCMLGVRAQGTPCSHLPLLIFKLGLDGRLLKSKNVLRCLMLWWPPPFLCCCSRLSLMKKV